MRELDDLLTAGEVDALVGCSAEPSALAGFDGAPDCVVKSNLVGSYNCLELARRRGTYLVFLSTSRVYPVEALSALALEETATRFELTREQRFAGASPAGISRLPAPRRTHPPGLDEARRGATDRGVPRGVRTALSGHSALTARVGTATERPSLDRTLVHLESSQVRVDHAMNELLEAERRLPTESLAGTAWVSDLRNRLWCAHQAGVYPDVPVGI